MEDNPLIVILLGAPGSGKGTQAHLLEKKFDLEYIGSGDLLRKRKKKNDFTGKKIAKTIDKGERVATPVIFKIWMDKLESFKEKEIKGIIFDGSPRTKEEAEMLEQALEWYNWNRKKVFFISISKEESINRLTKRRVCQECGRNIPWIGDFKKLKKCDKCGGKLITRADDTKEGVEKRWEWFESDVRPAINYYKDKGILIEINGEQSIEEVHQDIIKNINSNQ